MGFIQNFSILSFVLYNIASGLYAKVFMSFKEVMFS